MNTIDGFKLATSAAALLVAGAALSADVNAQESAGPVKVSQCQGLTSCHGQSACKGFGNDAGAGKNSCSGMGFVSFSSGHAMVSKSFCDKLGGKEVASVAAAPVAAVAEGVQVAYCNDLGYGAARGAEMLSVMLGLGVVSRIVSGFIADRIGALSALLLGSTLQGVALFLYLFFDSMTSLYVISGLFGLFQGGIVPMYAVIVREYFPSAKAGGTAGVVIMATLVGMAAGGWMSGFIFDWTGSYRMAFLNGLAWNLVNVAITAFLLLRSRTPKAAVA